MNNNILLHVVVDYGVFKGVDALLDLKTGICWVTQATLNKLLDWNDKHAPRFLRSNSLKVFVGEDFATPTSIKAEDSLGRKNTFKALPLKYATQVVTWAAIEKREQNAIALLAAGFMDSFRSLVYEQAEIEVSKQKRIAELERDQEWAKQRQWSKDFYKVLCEAVHHYWVNVEEQGSLPHFAYHDTADALNICLFGKKSKVIREELGLPKGVYLNRDHFGVESNRRIVVIQELAACLIKHHQIQPVKAVEQAVKTFGYQVIDYVE